MSKKPLIFRNQHWNNVAQRDHVQYIVYHSLWLDGNAVDPYYIGRWDMNTKESFTTERIRRFKTPEDAMAYCQNLFDGKVDLKALRAEIQSEREARENREALMTRREIEEFERVLMQAGITFTTYWEITQTWLKTGEEGRNFLLNEIHNTSQEAG